MVALKIVLVESVSALHDCLSAIAPLPSTGPVHVAVDIEGVNLSRDGRISIIQLFVKGSDTVWLIDVTTLGDVAFDGVDNQARSLRGFLQDPTVTKYMYDGRNDSDALYSLHHVALTGVYDLQLLELATRAALLQSTRLLHGLRRSITTYLIPPQDWQRVKDRGCALFDPKQGGRYEVFEQRPLDPRLIAYCAQDVTLLFQLEDALKKKMGRASDKWENRIVTESADRVKQAQRPEYMPHGQYKVLPPSGWSIFPF